MPVMGFTTVRVNVGALIIDGIDDDDIYDDVPVSGKLLLEPMIDPGRPVQVADGGRMKIKAIAPFPVDIGLNGEISHRNRDYVTVPAPTSATSNVTQLQWKATFLDLKYGVAPVSVPPIYFWAEPGLQIDLGDHINIAPNPTAVQLSRGARGFGVVGAVPVEDEPVASFAIEYETSSGTALSDPIPLPEGSGGLTEEVADGRYAPIGSVGATRIDTLDKAIAHLDMRAPAAFAVAQASDSTGDSAAEWFELSWKELLAEVWPERPAQVRRYDKATETLLAATAWQAGTATEGASAPGTVFGQALFETPAANLVGTAPDVGVGTWTSALGTWAVADGAARQTDAANLGIAGFQQLARNSIDGTYTCEISIASTGAVQVFTLFPVIASSAISGNRLSVELSGTSALTGAIKLAGTNAVTLATSPSGEPATLTGTPQDLTVTVTISGLTVTAVVGGSTMTGTLTQAQKDLLTGQFMAISINKNATLAVKSLASAGVGTSAVYLGMMTAYNGGYAGGRASFNIDRMAAMYPVRPDIMFINHGHNYKVTDAAPSAFVAAIEAFVTALHAVYPDVPIVCISQNPEFLGTLNTDPAFLEAHRLRQVALREHCREVGWGYIPSYEAFSKLSDGGKSLTNADGVHPLSGGMRLQADVAKAWVNNLSQR